jgi:putative oxidoreductase
MTRPVRAYRFRTLGFTVVYVAINFAAIGGLFDRLSGSGRWALSLAVALPIAGQIWATLAFVRDSDEFVRAITAKRFILASGVAMGLFSAWGFAESYAQAPHAPGWLVYALFWGVYGIITPFVRSSR